MAYVLDKESGLKFPEQVLKSELTEEPQKTSDSQEQEAVQSEQPSEETPSDQTKEQPELSENPQKDSYEHRWKVSQGMLRKVNEENKSLNDRVSRLTDKLAEFTSLIAQVTSEKNQSKKEQPKEPDKPIFKPESFKGLKHEEMIQSIEDTDTEGFSTTGYTKSDLANIARIVNKINKPMMDHILSQIERLSQTYDGVLKEGLSKRDQELETVKQVVNKTTEDAFYDQLRRLCPNWLKLNSDQDGFLPWAAQPILPYDARTRIDVIQSEFKAFNAPKVASVFNEFNELVEQQQPKKETPKTKPDTSKLEKEVVPDKSMSSPSAKKESDKKGKTWQMSDVRKFYEDCRKGKYTRQQEEELDNEITKALAEGRVTGS